MTICDLTHAFSSKSGGIRTYICEKRRYLLEQSPHTHALIIPAASRGVDRQHRATVHRIRGPRIPGAAPYRFFPGGASVFSALRDVEPDVIELNTYYMPPEARVAFRYRSWAANRGRRVGVVVHYHTDFAHAYARSYTRPFLGERLSDGVERLARVYVRSILTRADAILTFSDAHGRTVAGLGVPTVHVVPQFVDLELFNPARRKAALRSKFGMCEGDAMLIFAGRFDSEKHVDVVIDAWRMLEGRLRAHLVLVGNGPLFDDLSRMAGREERLTVLPYVEDRLEFARLMASADIYVTAGPHEVAAFSVVEALSSGLPCVGVDAGGLRGRIVPGVGYLGPVRDSAAMARNVLRAWTRRFTLSQAARQHAEAWFGIESSFGEILSQYERVMADRSTRTFHVKHPVSEFRTHEPEPEPIR